jgi:hypothetical protein
MWTILLRDNAFGQYMVLNTDKIPDLSRTRGSLPSVRDLQASYAISHYLRALWIHTTRSMRDHLGAEIIDKARFHVVLTLTTVWAKCVQRALRKGAKIAGMLDRRKADPTKLTVVRRSTAAAQAAIYEGVPDLHAGDSYVICFAGGGSVVNIPCPSSGLVS